MQSRYYNPEVGRFLNSDTLVATGQGMLGNNMFAYCLNDPVILADHNGEDATIAFSWWSGSMWWLCGVDAVLPVGDIIYVAGTLILGVYALTVADKVTTPQISLEEENEEAEPEPPDVTYPGDPAESPGEDYEWRGKQPVGGDKGAWVNKTTGEQWHPDLNHKPPKGPHWDYTDIFGVVWSIFEDGRILIWR